MRFRWNDWNIGHIGEHGIVPAEAEYVVEHAKQPYPEMVGDEKLRVRGRTRDGLYLQVVFIFSPRSVIYVIHARPLTGQEIHQYRRRIR